MKQFKLFSVQIKVRPAELFRVTVRAKYVILYNRFSFTEIYISYYYVYNIYRNLRRFYHFICVEWNQFGTFYPQAVYNTIIVYVKRNKKKKNHKPCYKTRLHRVAKILFRCDYNITLLFYNNNTKWKRVRYCTDSGWNRLFCRVRYWCTFRVHTNS